MAVAERAGLLIRYACISILKHDEWSHHGDFGGKRDRVREREGAGTGEMERGRETEKREEKEG